jgi:hypothetical protein
VGINDTRRRQAGEINREDIWRTLFGARSGSVVCINPDKYYEYLQDRPGKFHGERSGKLRWRESKMQEVAMQHGDASSRPDDPVPSSLLPLISLFAMQPFEPSDGCLALRKLIANGSNG